MLPRSSDCNRVVKCHTIPRTQCKCFLPYSLRNTQPPSFHGSTSLIRQTFQTLDFWDHRYLQALIRCRKPNLLFFAVWKETSVNMVENAMASRLCAYMSQRHPSPETHFHSGQCWPMLNLHGSAYYSNADWLSIFEEFEVIRSRVEMSGALPTVVYWPRHMFNTNSLFNYFWFSLWTFDALDM